MSPRKLPSHGFRAIMVVKLNTGLTTMKTAALIINVIAFSALFAEYAVAMQPPQPAGTRRLLQAYAGQLPTGAYPTLKPVWELGFRQNDRA